MDIIIGVLGGERDHAREIVDAVIDAEQNYLFTNDTDYKENRSSIVPVPEAEEEPKQQFDPNGRPLPPRPA